MAPVIRHHLILYPHFVLQNSSHVLVVLHSCIPLGGSQQEARLSGLGAFLFASWDYILVDELIDGFIELAVSRQEVNRHFLRATHGLREICPKGRSSELRGLVHQLLSQLFI